MNVKDVFLMLLKLDYRAIDTAQSYFNEEEVGNAIENQEYQEKKFSSQQRYGLSIMDMKKLRSQFLSL